MCNFCVTPATSNEVIELAAYLGVSELVNTETQTKLGTAADYQVICGMGPFDYTAGTKLWFGLQNISAAHNITVRNGNFMAKQ